MAPVLKTGIPERVSGVRIPPSPPYIDGKGFVELFRLWKRSRAGTRDRDIYV